MKISRKLKSVWTTAFLTAAFFFLASLQTWARETATLKIRKIIPEEGVCTVYVDQDAGSEFVPLQEESEVLIGDKACGITEISNYGTLDDGIVYDCIIDVSGSMDKARMTDVQEILRFFAENKKDKDVFRITRMGNERFSSGFLSDYDEIEQFISETEVTREDTNLYKTIKEELDSLEKAKDLPERKCLLIFSDGAEEQAGGITIEEALDQVRQSEIPVYTAAMLKEHPTEEQLEAAKILGSFARTAYNGRHYTPVLDQMDNEQVYRAIQDLLDSGIIVSIDASELRFQADSLKLSLNLADETYSGHAEQQLDQETVLKIYGQGEVKREEAAKESKLDAPEPEEESRKETEAPVTDGETKEKKELKLPFLSQEKGEKKISIWIAAIILVIFVLLIALIITVILISSNKSKKKEERYQRTMPDMPYEPDESEMSEMASEDASAVLTLSLEQIRTGETEEIPLTGEVLIGRGGQCHLSRPEDMALSEIHCILSDINGYIYIRDNNSTNGTYVNGTPIYENYQLSFGDVLLIGSSEYKITWR